MARGGIPGREKGGRGRGRPRLQRIPSTRADADKEEAAHVSQGREELASAFLDQQQLPSAQSLIMDAITNYPHPIRLIVSCFVFRIIGFSIPTSLMRMVGAPIEPSILAVWRESWLLVILLVWNRQGELASNNSRVYLTVFGILLLILCCWHGPNALMYIVDAPISGSILSLWRVLFFALLLYAMAKWFEFI